LVVTCPRFTPAAGSAERNRVVRLNLNAARYYVATSVLRPEPVRVRSARWFTECERDGVEGRVLNASVVGVVFKLPLFGVDVCMRAACHARSGAADVRSGKASSCRDQVATVSSARPGEELLRLFGAIWRFSGVLVTLSTRGRCEEWGKRRAMRGFRVLREGREFYLELVVCIEDPEMVSGLGFLPDKASVFAVATRSRQVDPYGKRCIDTRETLCVVGSPRFCVSQARECARGLSRCSGTVEWWYLVVVGGEVEVMRQSYYLSVTFDTLWFKGIKDWLMLRRPAVDVVCLGPASWARSARWFTECERDGGEGRVLNASVVGVAFMLSLFGVEVCMRAACRARGGAANVWSAKATPEAVAIRAFPSSARPGKELLWLFGAIWHFGGVLVALSMQGRREEWGKRRAMLGFRVLREGESDGDYHTHKDGNEADVQE
ncbi:hypothetical protein Taro_026870, partial [Colocasia esculenta]|nr:hypothetical protein [Colocasia esculenta]